MSKELNLKYRPITELKPYKFNARKNEKAVKVVTTSIKEFGFLNPIIIDQENEIIAGHTRLEACKELGIENVPTIQITDLTDDQIKAFRIMDNKSTEYATWDKNLLKREFTSLMDRMDLKLTGFREAEINKIMNEDPIEKKGDIPGKYKIEEGKLYKLGNHRLMCGDSTDENTYLKLIPSGDIHMVYTDPPYGVSYIGTNNQNGRDWDMIAGDDLRGDGLYDMLVKAFTQINQYLIQKGALYVFHASSTQIEFEKALNNAGFQVKQQLIWNKHHVLGRSHYHWTHEPFFYASRLNENPTFYGMRDNKTIGNFDNLEQKSKEELINLIKKTENPSMCDFKKDPAKDYIHPTQKPVKMAMNYIINSSRIEENVLDCFAGSGSTLIACENTKRNCYAIELSQDFVSHIIERWETLTGQVATDENNKEILLK